MGPAGGGAGRRRGICHQAISSRTVLSFFLLTLGNSGFRGPLHTEMMPCRLMVSFQTTVTFQ